MKDEGFEKIFFFAGKANVISTVPAEPPGMKSNSRLSQPPLVFDTPTEVLTFSNEMASVATDTKEERKAPQGVIIPPPEIRGIYLLIGDTNLCV